MFTNTAVVNHVFTRLNCLQLVQRTTKDRLKLTYYNIFIALKHVLCHLGRGLRDRWNIAGLFTFVLAKARVEARYCKDMFIKPPSLKLLLLAWHLFKSPVALRQGWDDADISSVAKNLSSGFPTVSAGHKPGCTATEDG